MVKVGFYQFYPEFGQVERNLGRVLAALKDVEADLIVLPELAFTGYYVRDRAELESLADDPRQSATVEALTVLCRQRDLYLVTGYAERQGDRTYNSALLIGPEGLAHTYRKIHLFGTEQDCFDPGDVPLQVHEVRGMRVGMMVCFDWVFSEVARTLALKGADLICHPANLVLTYCQQAMITRCIENMVYAVTANRYGADRRPHGEIAFTGQSQIVAPKGDLIYRGPADRDDLAVVEVDIELARDKRIAARNDVLANRRPAFYGPITESAGM